MSSGDSIENKVGKSVGIFVAGAVLIGILAALGSGGSDTGQPFIFYVADAVIVLAMVLLGLMIWLTPTAWAEKHEDQVALNKWIALEGYIRSAYIMQNTNGKITFANNTGESFGLPVLGRATGTFEHYSYWDFGQGRLVLPNDGGKNYRYFVRK